MSLTSYGGVNSICAGLIFASLGCSNTFVNPIHNSMINLVTIQNVAWYKGAVLIFAEHTDVKEFSQNSFVVMLPTKQHPSHIFI